MTSYSCLPFDVWDGVINGIRVQWSSGARSRFITKYGSDASGHDTAKAFTEDSSYSLAYRLQKTEAKIL